VKVGDLVTMDKGCAPPELYGLGLITGITLSDGETGEPIRARIYWHGLRALAFAGPGRTGCCAIRYLHKAEIK
jgi:hypothetical protein